MTWAIRVFFVLAAVFLAILLWPERTEVLPVPKPVEPDNIVVRPLPPEARELLAKIREIESASADDLQMIWETVREDEDLRMLALARWVKVEPEKAVKLVDGHEEEVKVWREWGRLNGELAFEESKGRPFYIKDAVLVGWSESEPAKVVEIFKKNEETLEPFLPEIVAERIIKEMAKYDAQGALKFAEDRSRANEFHRCLPMAKILLAMEKPLEMLEREISDHPDGTSWLLTDLAGVAAERNPEAVRILAASFPTGETKAALLQGIANAEAGDVDHLKLIKGDPTRPPQAEFLDLLAQAEAAHPSTFQNWCDRGRSFGLEGHLENLIRRVVRYRWADQTPEEFVRSMVAKKDFEIGYGLERWLEEDETAALGFPASLKDESSSVVQSVGLELVRVIGKKDLVAALKIGCGYFYPEGAWREPKCEKVLLEFAKSDRETFVEWAPMRGEARRLTLTALASAWLEEDLPWVIQTLQKLEAGAEVLDDIFWDLDGKGDLFLDHLADFPPAWREYLIEGEKCLKGAEFRWLSLKTHPLLSKEQLEAIQNICCRRSFRIDDHQIDEAKELVIRGDWLPDYARMSIATEVMFAQSSRGEKEQYLRSIPAKYSQEGFEWIATANEKREFAERESRKEAWRDFTLPENLIGNLKIVQSSKLHLDHDLRNTINNLKFESWTKDELESVAREIDLLEPREASHICEITKVEDWPLRLAVRMSSRVALDSKPRKSTTFVSLVQPLSRRLARRDSRAAADWAMALTDDSARVVALNEILKIWRDYDAQEMEEWLKILPPEDRKLLLLD